MLYCLAGWVWFILDFFIYSFMLSSNIELSDTGVVPWLGYLGFLFYPPSVVTASTHCYLFVLPHGWPRSCPVFIIVKPDCGIPLFSVISRQGPWFLLLNACLTQVQLNARLFIYLLIFAVKSGIYRTNKVSLWKDTMIKANYKGKCLI